MNHSQSSNYTLITIIQYIASVLIILVHCGRLFQQDVLHFFIKSILCRTAVPFFLITTGYFFYEKSRKFSGYYSQYTRRLLKQYLFWSVIYLPFAVSFLCQQNVPFVLFPLALAGAFSYIGTCYHLWYYPGLFAGLWITRKLSKFKHLFVPLSLLLLLYSFGALETYSSYIENTTLGLIYSSYRKLFFTTRNGLFYSPIFVWLGFILAQNQHRSIFQKYLNGKLFFSILCFCVEGWVVFQRQGDDKNFFFSLIPFSLFFLAWILQLKQPVWRQQKFVRFLTQKNFLLHPAFLESIKQVSAMFFNGKEITGMELFAATFAVTSFAGLALWKMKSAAYHYPIGGETK